MRVVYSFVLTMVPISVTFLGCGCHVDEPPVASQLDKSDQPKDQQPRYAARLIVCCGKSKSSSCDGGLAKAEGPLKVLKGDITCGHPGEVSMVSWEFLEHRDGKDLYQFTRVFPEGEPNAATTAIEVGFSGKKMTLFEDHKQIVLIEPAGFDNAPQPQGEKPPGHADAGD